MGRIISLVETAKINGQDPFGSIAEGEGIADDTLAAPWHRVRDYLLLEGSLEGSRNYKARIEESPGGIIAIVGLPRFIERLKPNENHIVLFGPLLGSNKVRDLVSQ